MDKNLAKAKLRSGETVIGTFVRMSSISMEIPARTGFDLAIIDAEHGVHTMEDLSAMICRQICWSQPHRPRSRHPCGQGCGR